MKPCLNMSVLLVFTLLICGCAKEDSDKEVQLEATLYKLDSIYGYQFKNNTWEPTTRWTYEYDINTSIEHYSYYSAIDNSYVINRYSIFTFSPTCERKLIERKDYMLSNGISLNNLTITYDINDKCSITKETSIDKNGIPINLVEYINIDDEGNAAIRRYHKKNANGTLDLDFEDIYNWVYGTDKQVISQTIYRKKNNVTTPFNKLEYTYTSEGMIQSYLLSSYDPPTGQFRKTQENKYIYKTDVNVLNTYSYNASATSQLIRIDSTFLDKNKNVRLETSLVPLGSGFANSFKSEYFYSKK